ncbi:MAG: reverse transcriptase family protein [Nannocystaceae bacterium]
MIDFRNMRGASDLPSYLGAPKKQVEWLLGASVREVFKIYEIPKRGNRGTREIWEIKNNAVAETYKSLARKLNLLFVQALPGFPHAASHGYVGGRSTLSNAQAHLGQRRVLCADIKNFFRSISAQRVLALLDDCGLTRPSAEALTRLLTWDDHLPLGLHTSPIVANASCHDLDHRLTNLVLGGRYTRYADDLFFSGPSLPTRATVEAELLAHGLEIAKEKWSLAMAGRGLYVTGLSLEDGQQPRAPRGMKRRIRQDLHYAGLFGLRQHLGRRGYPSFQSGVNKIDGTIRYLRGIEREFGDRLHQEWNTLLKRAGMAVAYPTRERSSGRTVLFLLDESVPHGHDVLMLCLTVVEDVEWVATQTQKFLDDSLADTMTTEPERDALRRKGIHWNDLTPDGRTRATALLRTLPFRAFVAYAPLPREDRKTYSKVYAHTLEKLLRDRLTRYDGCTVRILAEENSKVPGNLLHNITRTIFARLEADDSRRPAETPVCQVLAKGSDTALPLPDLVLGVVGDFATSDVRSAREQVGKGRKKRKSGGQAVNRFEQVRDKVKAIFDLSTQTTYSRRKPFVPWPIPVRDEDDKGS